MDVTQDVKYLRLLAQSFPTIAAASTEIINLQAILNLPKGTEHFLADIHGEHEAFRHVLKNAFVPLAQYLPYSILLTVGGSLLVERFFSVPGLGPLLTDAIGRYDTNVVQGLVLLYATLGIIGVFLGDILMTLIDPRIRLTSKGGTR